MPYFLKVIPLFALLALTPMLALALPEDRNKPIQLEADRGQLDQRTGTSVYEGNVVIIQGSLRLTADTATIYTKDGQFQRIEATGKPATWRYRVSAEKEELHGVGPYVDYDVAKNLMTMRGANSKVTQGADVFTGDYIEYDTSTDLVKARGENGSRIQIVIQPKSPYTETKTTPAATKTAPAAPPARTPSR